MVVASLGATVFKIAQKIILHNVRLEIVVML